MSKRVIVGMIALVGFSAPLSFAQQGEVGPDLRLDNPALLTSADNIWNSRVLSAPMSFDWTMPAPALRSLPSSTSQTVNTSARARTILPDQLADWAPKFDYVTGEIGFMYGRATGKFGGNFKEAYILGTAGNDHLQISVGADYQDSSFRWRGR
jgi:hypothetical protein